MGDGERKVHGEATGFSSVSHPVIASTPAALADHNPITTPYILPPLPYDYTGLQPWIDEPSLRLHYDLHRTRVDSLNAAETQLAVELGRTDSAWIGHLQHVIAVRTSEHLMHCLFWEIMAPSQGGVPVGGLADQIRDDFGSFAGLKSRFGAIATSLEIGEWVTLVWQPTTERLAIRAVDCHQLSCWWDAGILLVLDVSEHAYYLQYHHRRAEYVHNWWNTVNWPRVAQRFATATQPWRRVAGTTSTQRPRPERRNRDVLSGRLGSQSHPPGPTDTTHRQR